MQKGKKKTITIIEQLGNLLYSLIATKSVKRWSTFDLDASLHWVWPDEACRWCLVVFFVKLLPNGG